MNAIISQLLVTFISSQKELLESHKNAFAYSTRLGTGKIKFIYLTIMVLLNLIVTLRVFEKIWIRINDPGCSDRAALKEPINPLCEEIFQFL